MGGGNIFNLYWDNKRNLFVKLKNSEIDAETIYVYYISIFIFLSSSGLAWFGTHISSEVPISFQPLFTSGIKTTLLQWSHEKS